MKQLNIIAAIGIVINVTVNLLLIPKMMAGGSAIASFCTQFSVALLQFLLTLRIIGIPFSSLPWLRCLIFLVILVPVVAIAPTVLHLPMIWQLILLTGFALVLGFATGLVNFKEVKELGIKN
jgi:peptidoglycan biosynthesis protein MviN/MurJ (putative lipid II flippase)